MRTFDLSPLYRQTVGYDRLAGMLDSVMSSDVSGPTYPPYNIEKMGDDAYRITIAVAGFSQGELGIEVREGQLVVSGAQARGAEDDTRHFLHRGIAERTFERRFQLAEHVRVTGAEQENGLLHIDLAREVPEALRPRRIEISRTAPEIAN